MGYRLTLRKSVLERISYGPASFPRAGKRQFFEVPFSSWIRVGAKEARSVKVNQVRRRISHPYFGFPSDFRKVAFHDGPVWEGTYLPKCRNAEKPLQYWLFSKNLHESTEVKSLSPPNHFVV